MLRPSASFGLGVAVALVAMASGSARALSPPAVIKGPYLTDLADARVEVRVELESPAPASLIVAPQGDAGPAQTIDDPAAAMHALRASGLRPGTTYTYSVRVSGVVSGGGTFTTAPSPTSGAPTTFLLYGDDRSDVTAHESVVHAMASRPADFYVNTGDVVADGGRLADWQSFFHIEEPILKDHALFLSIGNHELYDDEAGSNFARYFGYRDERGATAPYGTVRWSGVRFFFLNGVDDWQGGAERSWLERALSQADGEAGLVWRIAVVHHGPWSSGPHGGNGKLASAHVPELLASHHVDLILSGHDHIYERGQEGSIKYIVSGGGGAPLYPIKSRIASSRRAESVFHFVEVTATSDSIHTVARGVDGTVLDDCAFHKGSSWECDKTPAPAAAAPSTPPSTQDVTSRCGCRAPGSSPLPGPLLLGGALLAMVAAVARRRRG